MFYLCLSLAHLLTLCHIEATSRRRGGTRRDPPALQGYHHSPPPFSPLISSAFALWAIAELYILVPSLTPSLPPSLPVSERKLKISVIIDARTLKFCMKHPWTQLLRFKKNQFERPCVDHVLARRGQCFGHFWERGHQDRSPCITGLPVFSSTFQTFN